jgi:hypothetical protein
MILVTEEAKELFLDVEHPEGTVLHLDPGSLADAS